MPVLTKINTNSIAEDAITGDKFAGDAYLSNTANQNISGTYSENRLYTSDAYTLSGNATVNSHLTLSSVKPTADVVLTAGGAYTLTGTGVLSGGSLLAPAITSLTGMTGELGSVVTGAPALTGLGTVTSGTYNSTIGNLATFPTTHPKLTITKLDWAGDTTGTTETVVATYHGWQNTKASSTVWVEMTFNAEAKVDGGASSIRQGRWIMYYSTSSVSDGATSSFGTELSRGTMGRITATTTSNGNSSHGTMTLIGTFTSSSQIGTQYYVGLTSDADGTYTRHETHSAQGMGTIIKILEY